MDSFGTIGDFFPEKDASCRIKGCKNRVHISGRRVMYDAVEGRGGVMCPECVKLFNSFTDQEKPCAREGCDGKWIWSRFQQVEAHVAGKEGREPRGYCAKCRSEIDGMEGVEVRCRIRGCTNTWTWTGRKRMESRDGKPPYRACDACHAKLQSMQDRELPCRIKGCSGKSVWTRQQQLEYILSGKSLDEPPLRLCDDCHSKLPSLQPKQIPCRIKDCKNTWTCNAFDQLEIMRNTPEGKEPVIPARMCPSCLNFFKTTSDRQEPCRNRGCENKWTWTRAMQLGAHVHGHTKVPYRMCEECRKKLESLSPREMPCSESACKGTWTYSPEDQLKDELLKRKPMRRHCKACEDFLKSHQTETLKCDKCGSDIAWSAQEQLLTSLGTFAKPHLCASCNAGELAELPQPEQVITRAPQKLWPIEMPVGGPWNNSRITNQWPSGMSRELIAQMENSARRFVCIGDEFTEDAAWFADLKQLMEEKIPGATMLNAGMKDCTTALACSRVARDVAPFGPEAVIFSFAFADTRRLPDMSSENGLADAITFLAADFSTLVAELRKVSTSPRLFCWLPNPIYPQRNSNEAWRTNLEPDENAVRFYDSVLRAMRGWCQKEDVTVIDCKAMFEMVGQKSAMSWMESWCRPNADGSRNIANWIMEALQR